MFVFSSERIRELFRLSVCHTHTQTRACDGRSGGLCGRAAAVIGGVRPRGCHLSVNKAGVRACVGGGRDGRD